MYFISVKKNFTASIFSDFGSVFIYAAASNKLYVIEFVYPNYMPHTHNKYSLLMHCIKIKSPAKSLLNGQYVFVGGYIYFLCVLSCSSEEA